MTHDKGGYNDRNTSTVTLVCSFGGGSRAEPEVGRDYRVWPVSRNRMLCGGDNDYLGKVLFMNENDTSKKQTVDRDETRS